MKEWLLGGMLYIIMDYNKDISFIPTTISSTISTISTLSNEIPRTPSTRHTLGRA
jgi:hypothetical protein